MGEATAIQVLVTVKAYPQVGRRTGESVCVAGIRTDGGRREWVRLFPVPFRDLEQDVQFTKYQYVTARAVRAKGDRRPESWTPDADSLVLGEQLPAGEKGWTRRRAVIEPVLIDSMCELQRRRKADGTSLGAFRPSEVEDVLVRHATPWDDVKRAQAAQTNVFNPDKRPLMQTPYEFSYSYRCADSACNGHKQTIIDWEIGQAWRQFRHPEPDRIEAIRHKWLEELCGTDRDPVFFAGNMHQQPGSFLILGVFWPPKAPWTPSLFS